MHSNSQTNTMGIKYIFGLMWRHGRAFFALSAASILFKLISSFVLVVMPMMIIDSLVIANYRSGVIYAAITVLLEYAFRALNQYTEEKKSIYYFDINTEISKSLGDVMIDLPYESFEKFETREQYELAAKCIERNTIEIILNGLDGVFTGLFTLVGVLFIANYIAWWLWLFLLAAIIIDAFCEMRRMKYEYDNWEAQNTQEMRMIFAREHLTSLRFAKENRLYAMFSFVTKLATKYINGLAVLQREVARRTFRALWWSHLFRGFYMLFVFLFTALACLEGRITLGSFAMITSGLLLFLTAINGLVRSALEIINENRYANCLYGFLMNKFKATYCEKEKIIERKAVNPPVYFYFEDVSFAYPGTDNNALNNVSVMLEHGKIYGIVGDNGAGKTTFIKLLMGLYTPKSGRISVNGCPKDLISNESYTNFFATVFQDYNIYAYTIEENIAMGAPIDLNKINMALRQADLWDKVSSLPKGTKTYYSKIYDDEGLGFSVGEQQKLAIARAIYKDAPVFILDEPTASLSPQSEYELYSRFGALAAGKTVIYISHRLASCRLCDEILFFENGRIIEKGSHDELMAGKGAYYNMFSLQASRYREAKYE